MLIGVLGSHPKLSLAELRSVYGQSEMHSQETAVFEGKIWPHLGGVSKIAQNLYTMPAGKNNHELKSELLKRCLEQLPPSSNKYHLGINFYGRKFAPYRNFCFDLKKSLRQRGDKVRLVMPTGQALNTAQTLHNKLLDEKNTDLVVSLGEKEFHIGKTVWIQDIDSYSRRDMQRPCRDMEVGMLPPKLAQIMINLAGGEYIFDPFCGSGVILQEALLMGKQAAGSDIDPKMVACSNANLDWLSSEFKTQKLKVDEADVRKVTLPESIDAVVSESYLGPALTSQKPPAYLKSLAKESDELLRQALVNLADQLEVGSRLCLAAPCWSSPTGTITPAIVDEPHIDGYNRLRLKGIDQSDLTYRRGDQYVGRSLMLLERS